MRLFALSLLVLGTLSISGCMGLTSATNPSGQQKQNTAGTPAAIAVSPPSINFGSVAVGSTVSQSITISNTGKSNLSITQGSISAQGFAVTGMSLPMTIAAGKQTTLNVVFSPKALGSISGAVSVMSNASNSSAGVPVSGTGVAATSLLNSSSASLSFGNVAIGGSNVLGITLTNAGNSNVSISKVSISGADFTASGVSAGMFLAPGQNSTLNVIFSPTVAGNLVGSITVTSNATNSPAIISLSGPGVRPSSHSVTLSWSASASAVAGYNVYRSTVSGGPYAKLTSSPDTTSSYTDSTVQPGNIYYYVVTSLTSTAESAESSQVSAAIPNS